MRSDCKKTSALVRKSRKTLGLSQSELGKRLKLNNPQPQVSQYEAGAACPPGNIVLDIQDIVKRHLAKNQ